MCAFMCVCVCLYACVQCEFEILCGVYVYMHALKKKKVAELAQKEERQNIKETRQDKTERHKGSGTHLDTKGEDCDDSLEDESKGELPQRRVDPGTGQCAGLEWVRGGQVAVIVAANE